MVVVCLPAYGKSADRVVDNGIDRLDPNRSIFLESLIHAIPFYACENRRIHIYEYSVVINIRQGRDRKLT